MPEIDMKQIPYDWDYPPPVKMKQKEKIVKQDPQDWDYRGSTDGATKPAYKYDEGKYLAELRQYIDATYGQHYSKNQFQATEFIIDAGHGTGFCVGNIMKYAQRYGRKGTREEWRKDMMKVIHYAMMQLYVHDKED